MVIEDLAPRFSWIQVLHGPAAGAAGHALWLGLSQGDDDLYDLLHVLGLRAGTFFFSVDLLCARAVRVSLFDFICAHAGLRERWVVLLSHGRPGALWPDGVEHRSVVLARVREIVGLRRDGRTYTSHSGGLRAVRQGGLREAVSGITSG